MPITKKLGCFTSDGSRFAHCGPDGILRLWDTVSGVLQHEFRPSEHLTASASCMQFRPQFIKKKNKKKKRRESTNSTDDQRSDECCIAVGTIAGTVLVYSFSEEELIATLKHESSSIVDLVWQNSSILYSLSQDSTLVQWDVPAKTKKRAIDVKSGTCINLLSDTSAIIGSNSVQLINLESNTGVVTKTFTGHSSPITQVLPIVTRPNDSPNYLLSSAEEDRFIYAWCVDSTENDPVGSFAIKDTVASLSTSSLDNNNINIAVTTNKGIVKMFSHHLNGKKCNKPVKSCGRLELYQDVDGNNSTVPILASHFINNLSIVLAYSSSTILRFEKIDIDSIIGGVKLQRNDPALTKITKSTALIKTVAPTASKDTTYLRPGHMNNWNAGNGKRKIGDDSTSTLPMEERLNALALNKSSSHHGTEPPKSDNLALLLIHGLQSKDQALLQSALYRGNDDQIVNNTIRRLPVQAVLQLLQQLQVLMKGKGQKHYSYIRWVRAVLYHHMSHLSTIANRQALVQPFYSESAAMMTTLPKFTQLHARLDLILTHVAHRHQDVSKAAEPEALLVYKDEDSDEDGSAIPNDLIGGGSESEDNWDNFSEVNGPTDDESEMETDDPRINAIKRSLEDDDDDEVLVSDDDEEDELEDNVDDDEQEEDDSNDDMAYEANKELKSSSDES